MKAEEEARLKAEEAARAEAEEEAREKTEAEEAARVKVEEQARLKAEEMVQLEAETRLKAEEEARVKAEEEARLEAEETARVKAEEEARLKAEEASRREAEARLKAEEEARAKVEEEAQLTVKEAARVNAEEEARLKAEEAARVKAEQEAGLKAEEASRLEAEQEARPKTEEETRVKAEQEARSKDEETRPRRKRGVGLGNRLLQEAKLFRESSQRSLNQSFNDSRSSLDSLHVDGTASTDALLQIRKRVLLLVSSAPINRLQVARQERALVMLRDHDVRFDLFDGSDPSNKDRRDELFGISGMYGHYPQFFLLDSDDGTTFFGTFKTIEGMFDAGIFLSSIDSKSTSSGNDKALNTGLETADANGSASEIQFEKARLALLNEERRTSVACQNRAAEWAKSAEPTHEESVEEIPKSAWNLKRLKFWRGNGKRLVNEKLGIVNPAEAADQKSDVPPVAHQLRAERQSKKLQPKQASAVGVNNNSTEVSSMTSDRLEEKRRKAAEARERALATRVGGPISTAQSLKGESETIEVQGASPAEGYGETNKEPKEEQNSSNSEEKNKEAQGSVKRFSLALERRVLEKADGKLNQNSHSTASRARAAEWAKEWEKSAVEPPPQEENEEIFKSAWDSERLEWWRKNGKRLVKEKLSIADPAEVVNEKSEVPSDERKLCAESQVEAEQLFETEAKASVAPVNAGVTRGHGDDEAPSRKEILAERRRQLIEARKAKALLDTDENGKSAGDNDRSPEKDGAKPHDVLLAVNTGKKEMNLEESENISPQQDTRGVDQMEEKKQQRLAESQRLAERSARAREARLRREEELAEQTRQVELKGQSEGIDSIVEEQSTPITIHATPSTPNDATTVTYDQRSGPQSTLLPQMVRESERLSGFIGRYEKKLETVCHSLLAVAQQYEDDAETEEAKQLPLPEIFSFITQRDWFQRHVTTGSDLTKSSLTFSRMAAEPASCDEASEKQGIEAADKLYRITTVGCGFLKMDGPVEADICRFLFSLRRSSDGLTRSSLRDLWADIARLSGDTQSIRVSDKVDELIGFCLEARLIE